MASKQKYETDIVLGERYRDDQTGIEGVATSIAFFQHACERVVVEKMLETGELKEYAFDSPRLTHITSGVKATSNRPGGPDRPTGRR